MEEQKYILENSTSFELKDIFECGQCFRWNEEEDKSYTGVFKNSVVNVKKENGNVIFDGICKDDMKSLVTDYFDLNRDYDKIKNKLSKIDEHLKISTEYGKGIRILKQDLWETIVSFIISANNNIPRIKGIIERVSKKYGKKIIYKQKEYYTFPDMNELGRASVNDLRELGLGFRDKRVYDTTKMFLEGQITLEDLEKTSKTEELRDKLMILPGVGRKGCRLHNVIFTCKI